MKIRTIVTMWAGAVALMLAPAAQGTVVASYDASAPDPNPASQGWTGGSGAISNIDGRDAWHQSPSDGRGYWSWNGNPLADSGLAGQDWKLKFDLWVADNMQFGELIQVGVGEQDRHFDIFYGLDPGPQQQVPLVQVAPNNWGTRTGLPGPQVGWHDYVIAWDASANMVSYFIDGANVLTAPPFEQYGGTDVVRFGNHATLTSEFYISHLELVPEPATLCLFGLGGLAMLRRRR